MIKRGMFRRRVVLASLAAALVIGLGVVAVVKPVSADESVAFHWDFNTASGANIPDVSGNNRHGTAFNGPTYQQGVSGGGITLNGVNQYMRSNDPIASLGTRNEPYALSAWVRVPSGVTQGNIVHISSLQSGGGWCIPFLRLQGGQFRATGWQEGGMIGSATSAVSPAQVTANKWYQVLTTWDAENGLRLFVDGELVDSTPQTTFFANGNPVYAFVGIGNNSCSENQGYLRGDVDDVRVYNRVIEANDVEEINNPVETPIEEPEPEVPELNNTVTISDPLSNGDVTVTVDESCTLSDTSIAPRDGISGDSSYTYKTQFVGFNANGCTDGATDVEIIFEGISDTSLVARKFNESATQAFFTIEDATITPAVAPAKGVVLRYTVEDGGVLDADGTVNGVIVDPVALAARTASEVGGAGEERLADTGSPIALYVAAATLSFGGGVVLIARSKLFN